MIDWGSLQFERLWPLWLAFAIAAALGTIWYCRGKAVIPDIGLVIRTRTARGLPEWFPVTSGILLLLLLTIAMMAPSVVRMETVDQRARDFVILVDTSRSMRHDTQVRRHDYELNFERRAGAFSEAIEDPRTLPKVARYELARESLLSFLTERRAEDRVALIYFNDDAHPVSALTGNVAFVTEQLAAMDDYVNWGTDIAAAVDSSISLLERYPDQNKRTMILLTDAETRYTKELERQIARLAGSNLSFYLLWITADESGQPDEEVSAFLELARSVGNVVTIQDPDSDNLKNALSDVGRMEAYSYQEVQRKSVELGPAIFAFARFAALVWLLLIATVLHPGIGRRDFAGTGQ